MQNFANFVNVMFQNFIKWLLGNGRIETVKLPVKYNEVDFYLTPGILLELDKETGYNWNSIARAYGMHFGVLQKFNQLTIKTYFWGKLIEKYTEPFALEMKVSLYVPSVGEIIYNEFFDYYKNESEAIYYFENWMNTDQAIILETAVKRASGTIGKHYGTDSLIFLTPNENLIGASEQRIELVNEEPQYQVNWGADLWKCNIYAHDVIYDAGFQPDLMANQHYITAGQLHLSNNFEELSIEAVQPGVLVQLYSGSESNESHNLILASFITRTFIKNGQKAPDLISIEQDKETWHFIGLGAEADEAAASIRQFEIVVDTEEMLYTVTDGTRERIRFFKPKWLRDEIA